MLYISRLAPKICKRLKNFKLLRKVELKTFSGTPISLKSTYPFRSNNILNIVIGGFQPTTQFCSPSTRKFFGEYFNMDTLRNFKALT